MMVPALAEAHAARKERLARMQFVPAVAVEAPLVAAVPSPPPVIEWPKTSKKRASLLIDQVCSDRDISRKALLGSSRIMFIMLARREAIWLVAKHTKLTYAAIGVLFNRDHTTIIHAVRRQNEAAGENVRNAGHVRPEFIERQKRWTREYKKKSMAERLRKAEAYRINKVVSLFDRGKDSSDIASRVRLPEPAVCRILHEYRLSA